MEWNKENSSPWVTSAMLEHTKPCWYWDKKDLAHTPSQLEGLDPGTEAQYRQEGARFIFDMGTHLGLHYDTVATGIIYFHRFYMFHSFEQYPRYVTGACCLFLAGKVEETPKRCKDIIKAAHGLLNDVQFSQFGDEPKEEVLVLERILLQTINFDLQVDHPYQFLLRYAKQLKGNKKKIQRLVQMAWTFVNDSLCTTLSLQWEPEILAVAVMYLAGRFQKCKIHKWTSRPMHRRWWEQFVEDVPVDVLEDICHQILDLYWKGKRHTPYPPQRPPSLQPTSQVPQLPQSYPSPGSEAAELQEQPKTPPSRQAKRPAMMISPKEEYKAAKPPPKIPKLEKPPLPPALDEAAATGPVEASDPPKVQIPPPAHPAPVHQPPPLPHWPLPPPPSSDMTVMSTASSYMSGEGFQSLQSMMQTEGPSYGALCPAYSPPTHIPHHPRVYPPNPPPPPVPLPPASFPPPSILPPTSGYPQPPPTYNPNFPPPPPYLPPTHVVPPHPPPGLGLPPASYLPPALPHGGQPPVPPPIPPPGMPPLGGQVWATWMG